MLSSRYFYYGLAVFLVSVSAAFAGGPQIDELCKDRQGRQVNTDYKHARVRQYFAEAAMLPLSERHTAETHGISPFIIYINPERYFLGRETQQWLYMRQCMRIIAHGDEIAKRGSEPLSIRDEEKTDCLAAGAMNAPRRALDAIERDMERVRQRGRWKEVLPGPERRISFSSCFGK